MALAKERGLPVSFAVRYHPLFINQSLNEDVSIPKEEYFEKKWSQNPEEGVKILNICAERGKEEGLAL